MKMCSKIIILVSALLLFQIDPLSCFFPRLPTSKLNRYINSMVATDRLKDMGHSLISSVRTPVDNGLKKLRLFYINKYSIKAALRSTITVSSISTTVISTALYCASFRNNGVTGACSRRKKQLIEDDNELLVQPTQVYSRMYALWFNKYCKN